MRNTVRYTENYRDKIGTISNDFSEKNNGFTTISKHPDGRYKIPHSPQETRNAQYLLGVS